ncbi:BamA/TamA family outer membrane protein [Glaciimonas soli]|uniref:BamA/TamA family outer membrane protein n=1 Tax=Glaciimonas soli TaxID=2590999 RepID=A0A843YUT7_9BURK|nr:BamA/TamA family outer membrane protein [Glaciimonas soli]MQR01002.1 BamA/TamA family outer membrane protein [Glaciimonas soli]
MALRRLSMLWLLAALYPSVACFAQSDAMATTSEITDSTDQAGALAGKDESKPSYVALPIPQSNPALGSGLTLVGLALYNPNQSDRPWATGVGLMYAGSSHAFAAVQQASLMQNRLRLLGGFAYADLNLHFYGVGAAAGDRGVSIPMNQVGTGGLLQALYQVGDHWFAGMRYENMHLKSTVDLSALPVLGAVIPEADLKLNTASLGPAIEYDSRDDSFYPTSGVSAKANLNFYNKAFGSDVDFRQLTASWNRYWEYSAKVVLAARVAGCVVGGRVPFTNLCMFGQNNDLRGYATGQYRDRALIATQGEVRWKLTQRWGVVGFAGVGSIAPSFSELLSEKLMASAGAGVRWQASKAYKVNVSLDVAFSKDNHSVYVYVGEAF